MEAKTEGENEGRAKRGGEGVGARVMVRKGVRRRRRVHGSEGAVRLQLCYAFAAHQHAEEMAVAPAQRREGILLARVAARVAARLDTGVLPSLSTAEHLLGRRRTHGSAVKGRESGRDVYALGRSGQGRG